MNKSPHVRFIINMEQARYERIIVVVTPDPVGDNGFQFYILKVVRSFVPLWRRGKEYIL